MLGLDPPHSIESLIQYSKGFALAIFIGGVLKDDDQVRTVTLYCVAAVFFGACIAIYQHVTGTYSIDVYDVQHAGGLSGDPNDTAMLLLTGVPLAVYWLTHSNKRPYQLMFASVLILAIGAIALTQSRGGGVALLLILMLFFLKRPTVKVFSIGVMFVIAGLLFASTQFLDRMDTLRSTGGSVDHSLNARYQFVESGIEIFWNNPALGVGIGNFGRALIAVNRSFNHGDERLEIVAHNMYLEFFVENGVFAGLLFLTILASALVNAARYDKRSVTEVSAYGIGFCVSMSLVGILTTSLFLSQGRSSALWFFVGVGLAFRNVSASNSRLGSNSRTRIGVTSYG